MDKVALKKKYFDSKIALDELRDNATLLNWEILSKAYSMGKQLWGEKFSVKQLSNDMEMPYSTVQRCLALDRATEKNWHLVRQGKISAFKLAMVCQLKARTFQDEIVAEIIDKNLSTYQLKSFSPKNLTDIKKWKHKKAVEKGYTRQESAYRALNAWICRGMMFLLMPISSVGKKKEVIMKDLKKLKIKLDKYIEKYDDE